MRLFLLLCFCMVLFVCLVHTPTGPLVLSEAAVSPIEVKWSNNWGSEYYYCDTYEIEGQQYNLFWRGKLRYSLTPSKDTFIRVTVREKLSSGLYQ